MLDVLKVIILGIVEGITEWLPVSSTGHLILVGDLLSPGMSDEFMEMFNVVIQLGAIMAVVVLYFHKLNPFSPKKTERQKMLTWQMWIKVLIASVPAAVIGLLFNDVLDRLFYKPLPVAIMLIVYGILFIIVENRNAGKKPSVTKISQLSIQMLLWIGFFQMLALIPGTSRSGATIVGALIIGVSRSGGRVYLFSGDSGYVRRQPSEADRVRLFLYGRRAWVPAFGLCGILCCLRSGDQIFDGLYQAA